MKLLRIALALLLLGNPLSAKPPAKPQTESPAKPPTELQAKPQSGLPKLKLELGKKTLIVPVASTPTQRKIGLMHRTSLGANEGMLFVFDFPQQVAFWMKDTHIPLSVAYINSSGMILEIHDMAPLSEDLVQSIFTSVLYALEMPKGWFERNGIQSGTTISGLPPSAAQQKKDADNSDS